jgi:hypothetical protein
MAKAHAQWTVLEHGPIEKLGDNLWRVEGAVPRMSLRRVMTIARLEDGRLVIHNGIALAEPAQREVEAWGTPAFLIVPNGYHRLDAPAYKARHPAIEVLAPRGSRKKVEEVVAVDGTYEDFRQTEEVRLETLRGIRDAEGAMIVRSADGVTVVLNDVVFDMEVPKDLVGRLIAKAFANAPGPRVSRLMKLLLIKDRRALREDLERLAALPGLTRLIVAHDKVSHGPRAAEALRAAAATL